MKIVLINGSPRKGNSYTVAIQMIAHLQKTMPMEVEEIHVRSLALPHCNGCNACFMRGEQTCPHVNIVAPIDRAIEQADLLVITTPVFSMGIPGGLKNLIDHLSYRFHRPFMFDKQAVAIATTAGAGAKDCTAYLKKAMNFWGYPRVDCLPLALRDLDYQKKTVEDPRIAVFANKLLRTMERKHQPSANRMMYYGFWRAMAQSGKSVASADYQYWNNKDLLDKKYHGKVGFPKTIVGQLSYRMFSKILKI